MNQFAKKHLPKYQHKLLECEFGEVEGVLDQAGMIVNQTRQPQGVTVHATCTTKSNTVAAVLWHVDRGSCLGYLAGALAANAVDALFYLSNTHLYPLPQAGAAAQVIGNVEMENFFLESDYTHFWSIHSDIIPPPFALERMLGRNLDILTAVTPKPTGSWSYLNYYDESLPDTWRERNKRAYPHHYLYGLTEPMHLITNPGGRILPYDQELVEVAGTGWGCLLMSRDAVREAGENVFYDFFGTWDDCYWSWQVLKKTRFKMYCDTTVRCYHLCRSLIGRKGAGQQATGLNPKFDKPWYGWSLDEYA